MDTDAIVQMAAWILAVILFAVVYLKMALRQNKLEDRIASTRTDLMGLVRLIEFRCAIAGQRSGVFAGPLAKLAADLRSDFPDYFPPEVGGAALKDEPRDSRA